MLKNYLPDIHLAYHFKLYVYKDEEYWGVFNPIEIIDENTVSVNILPNHISYFKKKENNEDNKNYYCKELNLKGILSGLR